MGPQDTKNVTRDTARDLCVLVGALAAPFGAATHLLTCSEYATVEHHLEDAPAAVEAALIEVRRRVRPNEG